ncbi:MAG: acyl-CoA reductase [Acetobacter peroxydans]|nr:acyl-CoA reductase [Acetobacter peroxydans]
MPIVTIDESGHGKWLGNFPFSANFSFFDNIVTEFLQEFSQKILRHADARRYPDLMTFAYFCRRANLHALAQHYGDSSLRCGWGTIIHIAPSNIPINFAFSLVFGLLSGNSNIVRMPSRSFPQNDLFIEIFDQVSVSPRFRSIAINTLLIRSARGDRELEDVIAKADGLVVWGGDATVHTFRAFPKKPRCVEIYFPNRRSAVIIDATVYLSASTELRAELAAGFFNDTYLVDQNACSSPSMVMWVGEADIAEAAKKIFWDRLDKEIKNRNYQLDPVARIDKFLDIMAANEESGRPVHLKTYSRDIWCLEEQGGAQNFNLRFGEFIDMNLLSLDGISSVLRVQEQTLTYFGIDPYAIKHALSGHYHTLDRIVPVGHALDMNPFWDGKDILALLSHRLDLVEPSRKMRSPVM